LNCGGNIIKLLVDVDVLFDDDDDDDEVNIGGTSEGIGEFKKK
jgi:hypothetical protein